MYVCSYFNIARAVVTGLLIFVNIHHFTYTFAYVHAEAHTHKHTWMISTQEEWRQLGTGAWFEGAEERLLLETKAYHKKKNVSKSKSQLWKRFEQIKLPGKLPDYFLRSIKSSINQNWDCVAHSQMWPDLLRCALSIPLSFVIPDAWWWEKFVTEFPLS